MLMMEEIDVLAACDCCDDPECDCNCGTCC